MANVTDPLVNALSGSDPQNLMEYIIRQKIYDSRFWKEECFGLSVADVLEKSTHLACIGNLPTKFLSLTLKLLQLHPETDLVIESFIEQEDFKYTRALGCLYLRLTGRPAEIYETLDPLYRDHRKLRAYVAPQWSILHMDEYIHQLLGGGGGRGGGSTTGRPTAVLGLTLPRLPLRRVLQEAGYLPEGPRPTAMHDVLIEHGGLLPYLRYKAEVEKSPAALAALEKRLQGTPKQEKVPQESESRLATSSNNTTSKNRDPEELKTQDQVDHARDEVAISTTAAAERSTAPSESRPKKKQKKRNYDHLFKKTDTIPAKSSSTSSSTSRAPSAPPAPEEFSEEYWNEQRARLGLKPLK